MVGDKEGIKVGLSRIFAIGVIALALLVAFQIAVSALENSGPKRRPYDPNTMHYPVSPDQAAGIVREWIGIPDLAVSVKEVFVSTRFHADSYHLLTSDGSQQGFYVDCYTGMVTEWRNAPSIKRSVSLYNQPGSNLIPDDQLLPIALSFARSHYPDFDNLNMVLDAEGSYNGTFGWRQVLPGGVRNLSNWCAIGVNPESGTPDFFLATNRGPVAVSLIPNITVQAASNAALQWCVTQPDMQAAYVVNIPELQVYADRMGAQRLVWFVSTIGSNDPNFDPNNNPSIGLSTDILVDAHSGEIVEHFGSLGLEDSKKPEVSMPGKVFRRSDLKTPSNHSAAQASAKLGINGIDVMKTAYAPLLVNGTPYLYAKYLEGPICGSKVSWTAKGGLVIRKGDQRFELRDGSDMMLVDGKSHRLPKAMTVINGRAYLSPDAFSKITGYRYRIEKKPPALDLIIPDFSGRNGRTVAGR